MINDLYGLSVAAYSYVRSGRVIGMGADLWANLTIGYADNPLFANQSDVSGFASLTCDALEIPFDMDEEEKIVVDGVIQMDTVRLKATGAVGDILAQTNNKSELDARLLPSRPGRRR